MALSSIVAEKIDKDLANLSKAHAKEEQSVERELSQKISNTQRIYTQEVERAIESQVNLAAFQDQKNAVFGEGIRLQATIEELYLNLLPQLLETTYAEKNLSNFFQQVTSSTQLAITGQQSDLLLAIAKTYAPNTSVEVTSNSTVLGAITYTVDQTVWEFSLRDFLNDVQAKTISDVLALI